MSPDLVSPVLVNSANLGNNICLNCKINLSEIQNAFVPNCKLYLSRLQNITFPTPPPAFTYVPWPGQPCLGHFDLSLSPGQIRKYTPQRKGKSKQFRAFLSRNSICNDAMTCFHDMIKVLKSKPKMVHIDNIEASFILRFFLVFLLITSVPPFSNFVLFGRSGNAICR